MSQPFQSRPRCNHGSIVNRPQFSAKNSQHLSQNNHQLSFRNSSLLPHPKSPTTQFQVPILKQRQHQQCNQCITNQTHVIKTKLPKHMFQVDRSSSQLIRVLIDENQNIKDQNMYLQRQLNKFIHKDKEQVDTIMEYQSIMSILNAQNMRLHKEILYFSDTANHKVDKLKSTINRFFKNNKGTQEQTDQQEEEDTFTIAPSLEPQDDDRRRFRRNMSEKAFTNIGSRFRVEPKISSHHQNLKKEEQAFEVLLQQCRRQHDPTKRKQMRRRLIDLTYKQSNVY